MKEDKNFISSQKIRFYFYGICFFSWLSVLASFYMEYVGELILCQLCYYQRMTWIAIVIISSISSLGYLKKYGFFSICSLLLLSIFLSAYHLLIQYGFILDKCTVSQNIGSMEDFQTLIFQPKKACSEIMWKILELPITFYNFLFSFLLLTIIIYFNFKQKNIL